MVIVAGLIFWLKEQFFTKGKVVLLFQPAEETGQGAYKVLQDKRFQELKADYVFALHNIPKEPLHNRCL
jgi:metal-dependent amidase/aminoacylase/carboxypeptidase family protein